MHTQTTGAHTGTVRTDHTTYTPHGKETPHGIHSTSRDTHITQKADVTSLPVNTHRTKPRTYTLPAVGPPRSHYVTVGQSLTFTFPQLF